MFQKDTGSESELSEALINSFTTVQTALSGVDVALSSAYHKSHQVSWKCVSHLESLSLECLEDAILFRQGSVSALFGYH